MTRQVTGDSKSTLGDLMKRFSGIIPTPLDQAVTKIWGFTGERGNSNKKKPNSTFLGVELGVIFEKR